MKKKLLVLVLGFIVFTCKSNDDEVSVTPQFYNILSLGDSYTIGQSVCDTCRFPEQLKDSLVAGFPDVDSFSLRVIAQTGWTTTSLINAIDNENLSNTYDVVTLLIGVNNQYQNRPFSLYEEEFPLLATKAIELAQGNVNKVIVVSIPDYAYTPFGQGFGFSETTSEDIDQYNNFAEGYCNSNGITFINITDITRQGLDNPDLVASDGLHPSELAYSLFVERLLPVVISKIQ
ncbi:SGNH/GDSL hydrolase family protein [Winogradskyella flava]|uniref:SGNH/GDSL hydrolase family protein n=1 Tax=Winogradskyella flava TaxID=1884876 RepID=A0A842IQS2_9FLAO|nr:SGNH/GDSL hydrolase family protein [Winogradskyella flava]MBC2844196.1 SGNH/GDSL hydrolase family protein [Winogradskyella flava]